MPITRNKNLIEVNDVGFAYGDNIVLEHVTFNIERGDYVGIVGPNGGGKTTLLKILVGLLKPDTGTVKISGTPISEYRDKFKIGYVPQRIADGGGSFPATVYEIVESGVAAKTAPGERIAPKDKKAILQALKISGIEHLKNKLIGGLSGGQKQRVHVARALAGEPEILILDEPFVGIDVAAQKDFYAFLKDLNENRGLTILFVSHDIDVITEEVKSILCLNRGILCLSSPAQLHEPNVIETLYGKRMTHIHHGH